MVFSCLLHQYRSDSIRRSSATWCLNVAAAHHCCSPHLIKHRSRGRAISVSTVLDPMFACLCIRSIRPLVQDGPRHYHVTRADDWGDRRQVPQATGCVPFSFVEAAEHHHQVGSAFPKRLSNAHIWNELHEDNGSDGRHGMMMEGELQKSKGKKRGREAEADGRVVGHASTGTYLLYGSPVFPCPSPTCSKPRKHHKSIELLTRHEQPRAPMLSVSEREPSDFWQQKQPTSRANQAMARAPTLSMNHEAWPRAK